MRFLGYRQAQALMKEGCRVLVIPQFRGANLVYVQDQAGKLGDRIRSDAWDRLRPECHLVEKQHHGKRGQHVNYLWAYGELKSWWCTYQHPVTGQNIQSIVHAVTYEEAEVKGKENAESWTLQKVEEVQDPQEN